MNNNTTTEKRWRECFGTNWYYGDFHIQKVEKNVFCVNNINQYRFFRPAITFSRLSDAKAYVEKQ